MTTTEKAYNAMLYKSYPGQAIEQAREDWATLQEVILARHDRLYNGKHDVQWIDYLLRLSLYEYGYQAGVQAERAKQKRAKHKA